MSKQARRLLSRPLQGLMRRVLPSLCVLTGLMCFAATGASASEVCVTGNGDHVRKVCLSADANAPIYGHTVLGDTPEWSSVTVFWGPEGQALTEGKRGAATMVQADHIFEDIHPRLVDLDGDGIPEVILVQSSFRSGARLVVLGTDGALTLLASTPYIGRRNRWLAPIGAADMDGDGAFEIAFVDRPHLAKTLRIWRYKDGILAPVAEQAGLTNHRIGDPSISGGLRNCGNGSEMITANHNWTRLIASSLQNNQIKTTDIGAFDGPDSVTAALSCN